MNDAHTITRRNLLRGAAPATAAAILVGLAVPATEAAAVAAEDPELIGLPLAAVYAEKVAEAMAHPQVWGNWSITIRSGDANQIIAFRQEIASRARVNRAIEAHKGALAAFNDCCDAADKMSANYGGPAAMAVWEERCEAEEQALVKLLRLHATGTDNAVRAAYLAELHSKGVLGEEHFDALLRSMAEVL